MKSGLKHPDAYKIFKKVFKATLIEKRNKPGEEIIGSRKDGERVMAKKLREHAILFAILTNKCDDKRSYHDFEQEYRDFCTSSSSLDNCDFVDRKLHAMKSYRGIIKQQAKENKLLQDKTKKKIVYKLK